MRAGREEAFGRNPFDEIGVAARYEEWYRGPGAIADGMEKLVLGELLASFSKLGTLLEVGCGTGHFTRWFEQQGFSSMGVDRSAAMLAEARRLDGAGLVRADALALPFADRSFDLVALIATVEFLAEPVPSLQECVRVARHGLVVGAFNRWSVHASRRRLRSSSIWRRARWFGPYEMRRLLVQAAGRRARGVRRRAISWSLPPRGRPLSVPYADFLGYALELSPNS